MIQSLSLRLELAAAYIASVPPRRERVRSQAKLARPFDMLRVESQVEPRSSSTVLTPKERVEHDPAAPSLPIGTLFSVRILKLVSLALD